MTMAGVKRQSPQAQCCCFFVVLLSCTPLCTPAAMHNPYADCQYEDRNRTAPTVCQAYEPGQLDSLQALWGAWNTSTPNPDSNLAGWSSSQRFPCNQDKLRDAAPNWRGVHCLKNVGCRIDTSGSGSTNCSALIIGVTLDNASIVGVLPSNFGQFLWSLSTLELTRNPQLTGSLPSALQNAYLYILDLHDNNFTGEIPNLPKLREPLKLDLSGNRFEGPYPLPQLSKMVSLQSLNLARNRFKGDILRHAFENMTQLVHLDISSNGFTGKLPNLTMIDNLQILDVSNNNFTGTLPNLTILSSLRHVNLSWNIGLTGKLEHLASLFNGSLKTLSRLDLSGNQITGSLDSWSYSDGINGFQLQELYLDNTTITGILNINHLSANRWLKLLSLRCNNITNVLYNNIGSINNMSIMISLQENPYCEGPFDDNDLKRCLCSQFCWDSKGVIERSKRNIIVISGVISAISVMVVLMIGFSALFYKNKKYKQYLSLQVRKKFEEFNVKPTIFSYNELRIATRDFHPDTKLGHGSYGAVYKGTLPNGNEVAVKQLFMHSTQDIDDFLNEVILITGMKHRNLVDLKGCCLRKHQRLLVYEYVNNLDIDQILLGPKKVLLSWPIRLKICQGVAHGLHYLHALAHPRIIHRDIKASNILLDNKYEAKIADFGLALLFPDEQSHIMTVHVAGTMGYLAPEYATLGQLSDKVDVFSFGILCLEIVCGRRNINEKLPPDEIYISQWAWKLHGQGNLMNLVDPTLNLQDDEQLEVQRLINIALLCIQNVGEQRPSMARVVAMLEGDMESEIVIPAWGHDNQYLDSTRLAAFGNNSMTTVREEAESSSFINSSKRGGSNFLSSASLEMSEIRSR